MTLNSGTHKCVYLFSSISTPNIIPQSLLVSETSTVQGFSLNFKMHKGVKLTFSLKWSKVNPG